MGGKGGGKARQAQGRWQRGNQSSRGASNGRDGRTPWGNQSRGPLRRGNGHVHRRRRAAEEEDQFAADSLAHVDLDEVCDGLVHLPNLGRNEAAQSCRKLCKQITSTNFLQFIEDCPDDGEERRRLQSSLEDCWGVFDHQMRKRIMKLLEPYGFSFPGSEAEAAGVSDAPARRQPHKPRFRRQVPNRTGFRRDAMDEEAEAELEDAGPEERNSRQPRKALQRHHLKRHQSQLQRSGRGSHQSRQKPLRKTTRTGRLRADRPTRDVDNEQGNPSRSMLPRPQGGGASKGNVKSRVIAVRQKWIRQSKKEFREREGEPWRKTLGKGAGKNRQAGRHAGKKRTGANEIEVDWTPPPGKADADQEGGCKAGAEGATAKSGPPSKPASPVRGPAGRGKRSTLPAWMTSGASSAPPPSLMALPALEAPPVPAGSSASTSQGQAAEEQASDQGQVSREQKEQGAAASSGTPQKERSPPPTGAGRSKPVPPWAKKGGSSPGADTRSEKPLSIPDDRSVSREAGEDPERSSHKKERTDKKELPRRRLFPTAGHPRFGYQFEIGHCFGFHG